ncbi:MAG: integrase [Nevskiaceae bacterium]|nr:MAG: integrase [Nevskiaceae bacterium]TBR73011.1 MAG: integrase [Nevskiaceae bacterium]
MSSPGFEVIHREAPGPLATATAPLSSPDLARRTQAAADAILRAATPAATVTSYQSALRYLCAWAELRFGTALSLPVSVAWVQQFVIDHFGEPERVAEGSGRSTITVNWTMPQAVDETLVQGGFKARPGRLKMATIDHRLAVLSWAHREHGDASPTQDPAIRRLLSSCRKLAREMGEAPKTKTAAIQEQLDAMLATCDDSLEGLRDRALLLFGWTSGGRRRSEIALAHVEDVEWLDDAHGLFRMRQSKSGDDAPKPIKGEAATALRTWLKAANITEGPIFRRVWGPTVGKALSPHAVSAIVQRRASAAGLKGDFAGHSLRRGFVTEAGLSHVPIAQTMEMTGHRQVKTVLRYHQVGEIVRSEGSDLLERSRKRRQE